MTSIEKMVFAVVVRGNDVKKTNAFYTIDRQIME